MQTFTRPNAYTHTYIYAYQKPLGTFEEFNNSKTHSINSEDEIVEDGDSTDAGATDTDTGEVITVTSTDSSRTVVDGTCTSSVPITSSTPVVGADEV